MAHARTTRRAALGAALAAAAGVLTSGALAGCTPREDKLTPPAGVPYPYGPEPVQVADLLLPAGDVAGVVVTIHGGFWSAAYDRSLQEPVAADLVARGYAVWNLDYRSVGNGGGWPATLEDVAAGLDALVPVCVERGLPVDRVALVGHSAGGQLALWGAARHRLPAGAPGADPVLRPVAAVAQAGVLDLVAAHDEHLGGDAVAALLGIEAGTDLRSDPVRLTASPVELVPTGVPALVVTGGDDDVVPPSQSEGYAERAERAGDDVDLVVVDGEGHFEHLYPGSQVWARTVEWLQERLG